MRTAQHAAVTLLPLSCPAKTVSRSTKGGGMWLITISPALGLVFVLSCLLDSSFVLFSRKVFGQLQ